MEHIIMLLEHAIMGPLGPLARFKFSLGAIWCQLSWVRMAQTGLWGFDLSRSGLLRGVTGVL